MDLLYAHAPARRKLRVHFHALLKQAEHAAVGGGATADVWARQLANDHDLICIDEVNVTDVVEALFIGRLLRWLIEGGVALCLTSNTAPGDLYAGGLNRAYLLPAIGLIETRLEVLALAGATDYRRRTLTTGHLLAGDADSQAQLQALFRRFEGGAGSAGRVAVGDRDIPCLRRGERVAWFDFEELCGGYRSTRDYLAIAARYPVVLLAGVPMLTAARSPSALRFSWLVDILYDHHVVLLIAAEAAPDALFVDADQAGAFCRTASRLVQMGSEEWMAAALQPVTA